MADGRREVTGSVRLVAANEWRTWRSVRLRALADSPDAFAHALDEEQAYADEWWIDIVESTVDHPRGALWFAELDGEPVGMLFARLDEPVEVLEMGAMWVAPPARSLGLGTALLNEAMRWGVVAGAATARLWVATANPAAASLYESHGFEPTGETKLLRTDSPVTAIQLETPLSS
jgi:GNAT superfamily N-acetyltransferase